MVGPRAQDGRQCAGSDRVLSGGGACSAELRRRLLEPGQPENVPLSGGRHPGHAARGGGRHDGAGRPLSPVFRAGQGVRGPRRFRLVLDLLRTRQCAETLRKPLSRRDHRDQYRGADPRVHAGVLRRTHRLGGGGRRSDLCPRPAALGLDPDRTDSGVAQPGRRHARTVRRPTHRARPARRGHGLRCAALSRIDGRAQRRAGSGTGAKIYGRHARLSLG